nr:transposase [Segatella cerevisiae]
MAKVHFISYIPNQMVLFPQRIDEDIAENDSVRIINGIIDGLNVDNILKLYKESGRSPYHPRMMLKVIIYVYMNNIYSCRRIEKRFFFNLVDGMRLICHIMSWNNIIFN